MKRARTQSLPLLLQRRAMADMARASEAYSPMLCDWMTTQAAQEIATSRAGGSAAARCAFWMTHLVEVLPIQRPHC